MQQVNWLRCRSIPMCLVVCILLLSSSTAGGVDGLCGGHHSPIQGPACRPYGGAPVTGLTNLLYEVAMPQQHDPACDLSTPRKPLFSELIPPEPTHSYHLLSYAALRRGLNSQ